jgi:hypothetical protein
LRKHSHRDLPSFEPFEHKVDRLRP